MTQQTSNLSPRPSLHTHSVVILKLFFCAWMLIACTHNYVFACDNATNATQLLYTPDQNVETTEQIRLIDQQAPQPSLPIKQRSPQRTIQTQQQSYAHACSVSMALGGLNALGCCLLERYLPLWWPLNVAAARICCSLLLPSTIYAYLAFTEGHGITCHCSTMHTSAFVTDWATYLAIKKYN